MQSPLKHNMDTKHSGLRLQSYLLAELNQLGYEVVGDMQYLSAVEILRLPGMGGHSYRKIAKTPGSEPFPSLKKL